MIAALAEAAFRSFVLGGVVWFGLILFRVRNPHVHMTAWVVVLLASLAMPFVMHWPTLTIDRLPLPVAMPDDFLPADFSMLERAQPSSTILAGTATAPVVKHGVPIDWWMVATVIYFGAAGLLLLRLAIGVCLTWRLARAAKPVMSGDMIDADVRVSRDVGGPVTFGSTILVPPQFFGWDAKKRLAVLAHEGAHVANRDFYVLLLASINRAVFWFSPFSWWQLARLADLAEIISDARAIEVIDDRLSYAEILLDVASSVKPRPMELAMAQASTVRARVERIIAAAALPVAVGWRKRLWIVAALVPAVIVSAGMIAYRTPESLPATADIGAVPAEHDLDQYVGWYKISSNRVLTVQRDGERLQVQETGQRGAPVLAEGTDAFALHGDRLLIFQRDEAANVSRVLIQNVKSGSRIAPRIGVATARAIEADFARRVAEVPDRFREQVPAAGGKEAILGGIEDLRRGTPNYARMSAPLAAKIHRQVDELRATFVALGAVETVFFRGVGPGGYDIYGAKFANGTAEFRLLLEPDGKAADVIFRPDGNDELGGIVPCSEEPACAHAPAHRRSGSCSTTTPTATSRSLMSARMASARRRASSGRT